MANSGAMAVQLVRSTRLFPGAPYAYAARAQQPDLIFTAGACPLDEQGQVIPPGDVGAQMRQALGNLQIALEESGACGGVPLLRRRGPGEAPVLPACPPVTVGRQAAGRRDRPGAVCG